MGKSNYYHYYVEGQNEEKMLSVLKTELQVIRPGKIQVFNVIQERLTGLQLSLLATGCTVVLVFDTDIEETKILNANILALKKAPNVKEVICIPQVRNIEDELKRCCNIKELKELSKSRSNSDWKSDMIRDKNFGNKLNLRNFDLSKLWTGKPPEVFAHIENGAEKIKLYR